ncbi:MAG: 6-phosphogluconolactonase [Candidatus Promineifilaceae bacterium]
MTSPLSAEVEVVVREQPEVEAAEIIAAALREATAGRGHFCLVLSGGRAPRPLFRRLARPPYCDQLAWGAVHFFWSDERCVPPDHEDSNYRMAKELLLDQLPLMPARVHRMMGELEPGAAAEACTDELAMFREHDHPWPVFDMMLMGLGEDGHTASLFPGPISPKELTRPVMAVSAERADKPHARLTLTPLSMNTARHILFLVTGEAKAEAVRGSLNARGQSERWPAQRLQPAAGRLTWLLDPAAASLLAG